MLRYRTILYPVDLAAPIGAVRAPAFELSRRAERLRLLYVDTLFGSAEHTQRARRQLEALGADVPCPVEVVVEHDLTPARAILRQAGAADVDLVVMDTHGRQGLARFLLGSTARTVVQEAPCPVLTARPDADAAVPLELASGPVLVAVDFSDASAEAVRQASDVAQALGAQVDVLHVPARVDLDGPVAEGGGGPGHSVRSARAHRVRAFARDALKGTPYEGADRFGDSWVETGTPADVIAHTAEAHGSRLLVLGTKGLQGVSHLVAGSVAEVVVGTAPCPVLTVKTPERYAELRAEPQQAHLPPTRSPEASVR